MKLKWLSTWSMVMLMFWETSGDRTYGKLENRQAIPGSYTITLLVYSGVPDPTWPISCSVEEQLCHEIEHAPKEDEPPAILGYRGFRMQPMECEECDEFILVGPDSKDVQHAVLDTAPPDIVDDELREYVRQAIDDQ